MHKIIDTHCHLDILESQGLSIAESLQHAKENGIQALVQIGIDEESSLRAQKISHSEEAKSSGVQVGYTIGCHPTETHEFPKAKDIAQMVRENLKDHNLVGIGEVGVDLYHDKDSLKVQLETLETFLALSEETKLPLVIHSRDAFQETYDLLKEYKTRAFGVIHCFTYDYNAGKKFVDLGYYVSFSGIVAFKNATDIHSAAEKLPLDSMLTETDAPFLAPPPHRGKRNEPAYTSYVLERLFSLRKESNQTVENQLFENGKKFMNRKPYYHA